MMKEVVLSLVLFSFCLGGAESGVLNLTDSTFENAIRTHSSILVHFYAPWSGHCKALSPMLDQAAELIEAKNSKAVVARLDATIERNTAAEWNIRGYPTLLYFEDGILKDAYEGNRNGEAIAGYMIEKANSVNRREYEDL
jgi:protein disulfide-isomerase-like protein